MELKLFYILYQSSFVGDDIEIGKSDCIEIKKRRIEKRRGSLKEEGKVDFTERWLKLFLNRYILINTKASFNTTN